MGALATKDTRRISFDNNFAISAAIIAVPKAIEDETSLDFDNLASETGGDVIFSDSGKNIEIQEDNETEYWANRIDHLKKEHQVINKIIEVEYDRQIESTNENYMIPKITHERLQKIKPCFDWRKKIMECYENNPRQPLVCSTIVQAFANCVASCRGEVEE